MRMLSDELGPAAAEADSRDPATEPEHAVPRHLPAAPRLFTGRDAEVAALDGLVDAYAEASVCVIDGPAGIGKTTLVLHWARRAADRFTDGQLFADLHGYAVAGPPTEPGSVLFDFLLALGIPAHRVPAGLDARATLYRSTLSRRRALIVLDDARDAAQVRPLLPGSEGCLTVITSRNRLTGLVVTDAARTVRLGPLSPAHARELLSARLGEKRVAREHDAVASLIRTCGGLPLALNVSSARASIEPDLSLGTLAGLLAEERTALDALSTDDSEADVRVSLSCSYARLESADARMLRQLAVHPGHDISVAAAISLSATSPAAASAALSRLADVHFVQQSRVGTEDERFSMHDLVRAFAGERSAAEQSIELTRDAVLRVIDHYLQSALTAHALLPRTGAGPPAPPRRGVKPEDLADEKAALAWFAAEKVVLIGAVRLAWNHELDDHCARLAWAMTTYLDRSGRWDDLAATQSMALDAARRLEDPRQEAIARYYLGFAETRRGDHATAERELTSAMNLQKQLGEPIAQAKTCLALAHLHGLNGHHESALAHAEAALRIYRERGERLGQAIALNSVGWHRGRLGEFTVTLACAREAVEVARRMRFGPAEAAAWHSLGYAHQHLGHGQQARQCYEQALFVYQDLGDRYYEAHTLVDLADALDASGSVDEAREHWSRALVLLRELDDPAALEVRSRLS
jgi:tetratricopeptide (TPR) repeat protein